MCLGFAAVSPLTDRCGFFESVLAESIEQSISQQALTNAALSMGSATRPIELGGIRLRESTLESSSRVIRMGSQEFVTLIKLIIRPIVIGRGCWATASTFHLPKENISQRP